MTYPLFKDAPKKQRSIAFTDYLREKNVVIEETDTWLLIENCKYHKPNAKHYTAFAKNFYHEYDVPWQLYDKHCKGWEIVIKRKKDRSVKNRWHVHFIE